LFPYILQEIEERDNVLVVTQLRDPVDRVVSAYEFAIEVAGRKINEPDQRIEALKKNDTTVNTYNVWPWKYLIPFARDFIRDRLDRLIDEGDGMPFEEHFDTNTNKTYYYDPVKNESMWEMPPPNTTLDPYDNVLSMPLREWIETPEAFELVHNGQVIQLLGISNTSFWGEAGDVRNCFLHDPTSRDRLFEIATKKLKQMPHVGLQANLSESVSSLAASMGKKMGDKSYNSIPLKSYFFDDKDVGPDMDMMVTYNSSADGGRFTSITIREARWRLHNLTLEYGKISQQLKKKEPQLKALLEREEMWLDDVEAKREASLFWKLHKNIYRPLKQRMKWVVSYVKQRFLDIEMDEDDWYYDSDDQELLKISPLNDNITKLDEEVAALQQKNIIVSHDYHALKNIDVVKGSTFGPNMKAYIPFSDEEYLGNKTLGANFASCSSNALRKGKSKRNKAFTHMRTKNNEGFRFDSKSRGKIDAETIARIKEINRIDYMLLEIGESVFAETLTKQRDMGILESVSQPSTTARKQQQDETPSKEIRHDKAELR
jgi:hypothetical protein